MTLVQTIFKTRLSLCNRRAAPHPWAFPVALALLAACTCCPQYRDATVPNAVTKQREPENRNPYYLYVPSTYDRAYKWPLVILCHGTRPWDHPRRQMADWVKLAEERGFIVAAPELCGTSALPAPAVDKQIARQIEDERRILSTVQQIRGAHNISTDRIFLVGWSAGNYAVLYTGLKNPQRFRALALQQSNFKVSYVADIAARIDPHQPIGVIYGASDMLAGKGPSECIDWLEQHRAAVHPLEVRGGHRNHPDNAQEFFERVLREIPWLHVRSFTLDGADPLTVKFKTRGSFTPHSYQWNFGDGGESPIAEPLHRFAEPGTYRVTLTAVDDRNRTVRRTIDLDVPQLHSLRPTRTTWDNDRPD